MAFQFLKLSLEFFAWHVLDGLNLCMSPTHSFGQGLRTLDRYDEQVQVPDQVTIDFNQ